MLDIERLRAGAPGEERVHPQLESLEGAPAVMWNDPTPTSANSTTIDKPYHMIFPVNPRTPTAAVPPDREILAELYTSACELTTCV